MSDNSKKRAREVSTSAGSTGAQKKLKVGDFFDLKSMDPTAKRIIEARLLMHKREQARQENNFVRSDDLRERLNKIGVEVTDQKGGPSGWRFKDGSSKKFPSGFTMPKGAEELFGPKKQEKKPEVQSSNTSSNAPVQQKKVVAPSTAVKPVPESAEQQRIKAALAKATDTGGARNVQGVTVTDLKIGIGAEAHRGRRVTVHYIGKLKTNGKIFDQSVGKKPFQFGLGFGEVIAGWDIGVNGMKVGGKRNLVIPPQLAYGRSGAPPTIPPNATLVFDVQLLSVK